MPGRTAELNPTGALRVVFLPNVRQTEKLQGFVAGSGPDPHRGRALLRQQGIDVRERDLNRFPWNPLARRGSFWAGFDPLRVLRVLCFDRDADVVVSVFESNAYFLVLLAPWFGFRPKVVLWEVSASGWPRRDRVVDVVARRATAVFVLTRHQEAVMRQRLGAQARIHRVGFAVDERFYAPSVPRPDDEGYILAVGDDIGRDYATLIEACRGTGFKLRLRTGVALDIPADLRDQVTVLGRVSYPALRALYERAALVVVPLHDVDHPSGITGVFEAMAMACAVVASDTGTTRDFIRHGEDGCLCPPADVAALRAALCQLMADAALRRRLGDRAREQLQGPLSHDRYSATYARCLWATGRPD